MHSPFIGVCLCGRISPSHQGDGMDRIALISDIHGNVPALEATLQDIKRRNVTRIFCLGDSVGKGPHSDKVIDICREEGIATVKGNWEDVMVDDTDNSTLIWHQQRLGKERLEYLKSLPDTTDFWMSGKSVRLFHASQQSVHHRVRMSDPDEKHLEMFENTDFTGYEFEPDIVGCGDIHRVYLKTFQSKTLFNVGSVGNPLDLTQASYGLLEGDYDSQIDAPFSIYFVRIPYDIELSIQQAKDENMPDLEPYANELRTARYRGL